MIFKFNTTMQLIALIERLDVFNIAWTGSAVQMHSEKYISRTVKCAFAFWILLATSNSRAEVCERVTVSNHFQANTCPTAKIHRLNFLLTLTSGLRTAAIMRKGPQKDSPNQECFNAALLSSGYFFASTKNMTTPERLPLLALN